MQLQLVHVVEPIPDIPWLELDEARRNTQRHRKALAELTTLEEEFAWAITGCQVVSRKTGGRNSQAGVKHSSGLGDHDQKAREGIPRTQTGLDKLSGPHPCKDRRLALPSHRKWLRGALSLAPKACFRELFLPFLQPRRGQVTGGRGLPVFEFDTVLGLAWADFGDDSCSLSVVSWCLIVNIRGIADAKFPPA